MKIEFEVGKKYKNIFFPSEIYTCTFVGRYKAFLEVNSGVDRVGVPSLDHAYEMGWREYKEPVVHKTKLVWYKEPSGKIRATAGFSLGDRYIRSLGYEVLKVEEISYTESE